MSKTKEQFDAEQAVATIREFMNGLAPEVLDSIIRDLHKPTLLGRFVEGLTTVVAVAVCLSFYILLGGTTWLIEGIAHGVARDLERA